jgi:GTPase SAR1 family protein
MQPEAVNAAPEASKFAQAFEHSITWEDDLWRADPVDVIEVHAKARAKFSDLLATVTSGRGPSTQARILLFHGQSGAGKTHLLRALRTSAHRESKAYFGYAQMTPDIQNYADYYVRRLVHSLEKPYDPDQGGESALARLTRRLVTDAELLSPIILEQLREANLGEEGLAKLVLQLADEIVASPKYRDLELDINIVRALLYLERKDPRIDQRVRQYLNGRQLTPLAHQSVAALDPNTGEDRAFEIITALGQLIWTVDRAALVFSIDQVEDLRFFNDPEERFQKAVRDLIQIANRLPNAIIIISCLEDFYGQVRGVLAQSYIDRIEKAGPVALHESRTAEEARLIIAKRLAHEADSSGGTDMPDPSQMFGKRFFEEFGGLSTRRLLEHAQSRLAAGADPATSDESAPPPATTTAEQGGGFINTLAAALGFAWDAPADTGPEPISLVDFRSNWARFENATDPVIPLDEKSLMKTLETALAVVKDERGDDLTLTFKRNDVTDDFPAMDVHVRHKTGLVFESRLFVCNRAQVGGGLKKQVDRVMEHAAGKRPFILRSTSFPDLKQKKKNQTVEALRQIVNAGGRLVEVAEGDWSRMMTAREFQTNHRQEPGFARWFAEARLVSNLDPMSQLLRLDLVDGRKSAHHAALPVEIASDEADAGPPSPAGAPPASGWTQWTNHGAGAQSPEETPAASDDELPLSVILDETGSNGESIVAGRQTGAGARSKPITLNRNVLKRHAAVLGGSGSGKTTLALCLIEQLLLRGIPAVLIDRKGDLCSYANPDVWRANDEEYTERRGEREKLADAIDVAVYTPGRSSGRPISITLLPTGINELPEHEQQLLANLSAAALGDMLHLKNSATHQKQSGTLSVALRILGSRSSREVMLGDLIYLLEDEDPELTDLTQRMDPSGKLRRDLVAQLDSLRHRNSTLFEVGGESLRMDSLLGIGPFARDGRTRLSIIYTGFLGDNENILFWVSQFLSEALRFCQRNPNDELQAVVMFDEADLYIPANAKPATAEPLQSLLKRARSAGLGIMLATQSPGDLDYKSRDQITSWFIGRVREDTALRKLKAAFQSESGLDPAAVLPGQTVGEFHLVQEGLVRSMKAQRSLIEAEQVPFDRIEQLAHETKGQDEKQLKLFDVK